MANNLTEFNWVKFVQNRALNDISANLDLINANIDSINIQRTNRVISAYKDFLNLTDDERFQDRIDFIETRLRG